MKSSKTRLSLESLEKREMMAGDVRVYTQNGDLYIQGDNAANQVIVTAIRPGELRIRGEVLYNQATKINGGTREVAITGTPRNIYVNMAGGDDHLDLGSGNQIEIKATNDVWVDMGAGSDWVTGRNLRVGRDMILNTGVGARDTANVFQAAVGREVVVGDPTNVVVSRADKNAVLVQGVSAKKISTVFGNGQDEVTINSCSADSIYASLGASNDKFAMTYTRPRSYTIDGGAGYDTFFAPKNNGVRYTGRNFESVRND